MAATFPGVLAFALLAALPLLFAIAAQAADGEDVSPDRPVVPAAGIATEGGDVKTEGQYGKPTAK